MNGHNQKGGGGSYLRAQLEKGGGVIGVGQVTRGYLPRHIHVLDIYIYISPSHNMKSGTTKDMGHGLYSRTSLAICGKQICFGTQNYIVCKYYPGISGNIY